MNTFVFGFLIFHTVEWKAKQANSNEGHCICQVGKSRADTEVLLKNSVFSDPRKVCNGATRWQMSCKDYKLIAEK